MSKLNKQFEYRGYKFNMSVELNTKVEKKLNGKRLHTIITNCMGSNNYYLKDEIETYQIEEYVERHKQLVTDYIDKLLYKEVSFEEKLLSGLGFI
jgi:hypothetical protein